MKLLLDENLPIKLQYRFRDNGIDAYTVRDMGWLGKQNGELLSLMLANNFDSFLTIDNNLSFQQNFKDYPMQVIVLIANDNTYPTIMSFFDLILAALQDVWTGPKTICHPDFE
jgi:predicted nuclease of predicted toxin-antitoxin system